jgi:hypothetical protein
VNAPTDENIQPWQPAPPVGREPGALRYLWNHPVVIAGVMGMLLLLVTAVSIIAIKAVDGAGSGDDTAGPRNGQTNQPAAPAGSGTGAPATGQQAGTPAANPGPGVTSTNVVFLSGKLAINYYDSDIDLDTAKKGGLAEGEKADFEVTDTALVAANGAQAGIGAAAGAPTPAGCTAAAVKWGNSAHISVLAVGATICAKTSDDRLGALTVTKLEKSDEGKMRLLEVDYVVWKKQGDV